MKSFHWKPAASSWWIANEAYIINHPTTSSITITITITTNYIHCSANCQNSWSSWKYTIVCSKVQHFGVRSDQENWIENKLSSCCSLDFLFRNSNRIHESLLNRNKFVRIDWKQFEIIAQAFLAVDFDSQKRLKNLTVNNSKQTTSCSQYFMLRARLRLTSLYFNETRGDLHGFVRFYWNARTFWYFVLIISNFMKWECENKQQTSDYRFAVVTFPRSNFSLE